MQEEAERRDRERLTELKRQLAEQAEYDLQRSVTDTESYDLFAIVSTNWCDNVSDFISVQYRAEKRAIKLKEREAQQQLALAAEREREARLEAIREQVCIGFDFTLNSYMILFVFGCLFAK